MDVLKIVNCVENEFARCYPHFKEFQTDSKFKTLWDMCIDTIQGYGNMEIIVFCNDVYQIPPVKVFIDLNRAQIQSISESPDYFDNNYFKTYIKQCLGAFWGMIFRFALGYGGDKDVVKQAAMVADEYYGVKTASRFVKKKHDED